MDLMQFLIFEIGDKCNLAKEHEGKCPVNCRDRFPQGGRPLTDQEIVDIAAVMYYDYGFKGMIGFHYYNEPLLYLDRIEKVVHEIEKIVPQAQFVLWTNGKLFPKDIQRLSIFNRAWVTNYDGGNYKEIRKAVKNVIEVSWQLDARLDPEGHERLDRCRRPFAEFIIDYKGNVHVCCIDWQGGVKIGNVTQDGLGECINNFLDVRDAVGGDCMTADAPAFCKKCKLRQPNVANLHTDIKLLADNYLATGKRPQSIAVTFTHYNIPAKRLQDHFAWNDAVYRKHNARVYVVTDKQYDVPPYAECLVYPSKMPVFNLSKTSNYGVKTAINNGYDIIIKTDTDIVFSPEVFNACIQVRDKEAVIPYYKMSDNYAERNEKFVMAPYATGTISMTADGWEINHFNELCEGYGCDDGILKRRIEKSGYGIKRYKQFDLWHIAHEAGTVQKEFHGRTDHWNRDSGFNPENFKRNGQLPEFSGEWGTGD